MRKIWVISLLILSVPLFFITSCGKKIERVSANEIIDISGKWNDVDAQQTSKAMIGECLDSPWYSEWRSQTGKKPVVIVGNVFNKSHEHINTETIVNEMERALVNSGQVRFVANDQWRSRLRAERRSMRDWSNPATVKKLRNELGADFMLVGTINSIIDREGGRAVKFYQVDLKLINLETNEIVWIGQHKIKKYIKKGNVTW